MTQQSFDNYIEVIKIQLMTMAYNTSLSYQIGSSKATRYDLDVSLLHNYLRLLELYTLVAEQSADEDYYVYNYLPPSKMQLIAEWAHKLLDLSYNIDFILTASDEYLPIDAPTVPGSGYNIASTYNTTI